MWAAAALVAALWLLAAPGAARADTGPYPMFGVNVNRVFNDDFWGSHWSERLGAVHSSGIGLARTDAFWSSAEPNPPQGGVHSYDWSITDSVARALVGKSLRWLPILDYSAPWASSQPGDVHAPPASNDDYASYAGAFARRFGRGGSFWAAHLELPYSPVTTYEIWNEENGSWFWKPGPDPARYADMYLKARDAIRAADPRATVVVGGLVPGTDFLKEMVAARPEVAAQIDGVAFHPYAPTAEGVLASVRSLRQTLDAIGMASTPIHITEVGWPTSGNGSAIVTSEAERASYMAQATDTLARSDCGIADVIPYTWTTPESDATDIEDWYGMFHWNGGGATPTGAAYLGVVRRWAADPVADGARIPVCHSPPAADLSTATTASAPTAITGGMLRYTVTVANAGADPAQDASVLAAVPAGVPVVSATPSSGSCVAGEVVSCSVGTIDSGRSATVAIVVRAQNPGPLQGVATATSATPDPNTSNNASSASSIVTAPPFTGVSLPGRRAAVTGNRLDIPLSCPRATYGICAGRVAVSLPGAPRQGFWIAPGRSTTVRLQLATRSLKALRRQRKLRATVTATDGAAQSSTGTWKLAAF